MIDDRRLPSTLHDEFKVAMDTWVRYGDSTLMIDLLDAKGPDILAALSRIRSPCNRTGAGSMSYAARRARPGVAMERPKARTRKCCICHAAPYEPCKDHFGMSMHLNHYKR